LWISESFSNVLTDITCSCRSQMILWGKHVLNQQNSLNLNRTRGRDAVSYIRNELAWKKKEKKKNMHDVENNVQDLQITPIPFHTVSGKISVSIMNKRCTHIEVIRFHAPVCLLCGELSESSAWGESSAHSLTHHFVKVMRVFYIQLTLAAVIKLYNCNLTYTIRYSGDVTTIMCHRIFSFGSFGAHSLKQLSK